MEMITKCIEIALAFRIPLNRGIMAKEFIKKVKNQKLVKLIQKYSKVIRSAADKTIYQYRNYFISIKG